METKWVNRDIIDQDQQEENSINMDTEEEEGGVGESEKKKKAVPPPLGRLPRGSSSGGAVSPLSCQADRCGTDLCDAKRYHRRHKVCEVHSKAPVVLVAGLRQRFCQQCSRFHEVSEFDEAKRSCRRRLAGHNERRRKSSAESCHGESSSTPKTSRENSTACKQFYMRS